MSYESPPLRVLCGTENDDPVHDETSGSHVAAENHGLIPRRGYYRSPSLPMTGIGISRE